MAASYALGHRAPAASLVTVRGVIGSEKQPYFQDPDVIKVFHRYIAAEDSDALLANGRFREEKFGKSQLSLPASS